MQGLTCYTYRLAKKMATCRPELRTPGRWPLLCQRSLRAPIRSATALIMPGSALMIVSPISGDSPFFEGFLAPWGRTMASHSGLTLAGVPAQIPD
jgi:hypothetical protein